MKTLDNLLLKIDVRKKAYEQLDTLKLFDNLTNKQIDELTSAKYNKSAEAGIVIKYLGYSKLKHRTSELLVFLQDTNWPASDYVIKVLQSADEDIIPIVKSLIKANSNDRVWVYWIIVKLVSSWDTLWIYKIQNELLVIIDAPDGEGASYEALKCIKKVISEKDYIILANKLLQELNSFESMVFEIKELKKDLKQ